MKCHRARQFLALMAGGDLRGPDVRRVAEHLEACSECREFSESLFAGLAWLRSAVGPWVSESEYAGIRRTVWNRVREDGTKIGSFPGRRRAALAGGVLAAVLATLLLVAHSDREGAVFLTSAVPSHPVPAAPAPPAVFQPETTVEALRSATLERPVAEKAASLPSRGHQRRSRPIGAAAVDRIEFRTANPDVRVIWLVRKGGEKSSSNATGRNQEVS